MAEITFWFCFLVIIYCYVGYPLFIHALAAVLDRVVKKAPCEPTVSVLISAFNEEEHIAKTIENKILLDYPRQKLEIVVVSDGSTDRTDEIVKGFGATGVRFFRQDPRAGKTAALNIAVPEAKGEIIVFSDANSIYDKAALRRLIENFADPSVGYVTGRMIYTNPDHTPSGDGCSAYMKYENFIRAQETRLGSVVGVDGGIDAVRKSLYDPMNPDQLPDFVLPLRVVEKGFRVVYEPTALLYEEALKTNHQEYRMRVRVALRSLWALKDMRQLLASNSLKLFSWQLWSHKVLRYLAFVFLAGAFLSNLWLFSRGGFYRLTFVAQTLLYGSTLIPKEWASKPFVERILHLSNYFVILNLASAHAFVKFLLGRKQVIWLPRQGA